MPNSGWRDQGFNGRVDYEVGRGLFSAGWQSDFGRDIERPRNNSRAASRHCCCEAKFLAASSLAAKTRFANVLVAQAGRYNGSH